MSLLSLEGVRKRFGSVEALRGVTFTLWIAAAVALGMSFPTWFIGVGDFKFTRLFVPILQVIMFGMGTTLSVADLRPASSPAPETSPFCARASRSTRRGRSRA